MYTFTMQGDGDAVILTAQGAAIWSIQGACGGCPTGSAPFTLTVQADGYQTLNFVMQDVSPFD